MMSTAERSARDLAIARLKGEGFTVLPPREAMAAMPPELRFFSPDLVGRRGDDHVIVEFVPLDSPGAGSDLRRVAEAVERLPHWRLDLHMVGSPVLDNPEFPDRQRIQETVSRSARLFADGDRVAALLLLWAAYEAAALYALHTEDVDVRYPLAGAGLAHLLAFHGLIDDAVYDRLREVQRFRNRVAHGQLDLEVDTATFTDLRATVERMLQELEPEDA